MSQDSDSMYSQKSSSDKLIPLRDNAVESGKEIPLPPNPTPINGRAPVYYQPTGYSIIDIDNRKFHTERESIAKITSETNVSHEQSESDNVNSDSQSENKEIKDDASMKPEVLTNYMKHASPEYLTEEQFNQLSKNLKKENGQYLAMTCYGSVPVPKEMLSNIPEKIDQEPIIKESKRYVVKKVKHDRLIEKEVIQHRHHFVEVATNGIVKLIKPTGEESIVQIPRYNYRSVVSENVINCPKGFRYIETPLDVSMKIPVKVVPKIQKMYIERQIKFTKPVIKQKVVEVPKIVKKYVDRVVEKEIPYYVPKYVEKVLEVNFKPGMRLPHPSGKVYTEIPDLQAAEEYVNLLNEKHREGIDENIIISHDGIKCRLAPDGKTILGENNEPLRNSNSDPIVIGEEAPENDMFSGCRIVNGVCYLPKGFDIMQIESVLPEIVRFVTFDKAEYVVVRDENGDCIELDEVADEDKVAAFEENVIYDGPVLNYIPKKLVPDAKYETNNDGIFVPFEGQSYNETPEYIQNEREGIYAVPLDPVTTIGAPRMRGIKFMVEEGNGKVLTTYGEMNPNLASIVTCGKPGKIMKGPFKQSKTSVPLDQQGFVDIKKLEEIKDSYAKRLDSSLIETLTEKE